MNDFQTSPMLFVFIILLTSFVVGALGGWQSISVDVVEDDGSKPEEAPTPVDVGMPAHSKAA